MKVHINIYDIQKTCNQKGADMFGFGIYHSGVEINRTEYAFGGNTTLRTTGVYECYPKEHAAFSYKTTIYMGEISPSTFFKNKPVQHKNISF